MRIHALCVVGVLCVLSNTSSAIQRMGLSRGSTGVIAPNSHGSLESVCLDEYGAPPLTTDHYTTILGQKPNSITVKIGNNPPVPLQDAIKAGKVSISGISSRSEALLSGADISSLRVNNLTNEPVLIEVHETTILGTDGHKPFDSDVRTIM